VSGWQEIDRLIGAVEQLGDASARETARALVRALLDLHGAALQRWVAQLDRAAVERAAADPEIAALLVLHGLHPVDLETRVKRALADLPRAELVEIAGGIVRARAARPEEARERLLAAAPDALAIEVSGDDLVPAGRLVGGMR
jgi:hypothetical protein